MYTSFSQGPRTLGQFEKILIGKYNSPERKLLNTKVKGKSEERPTEEQEDEQGGWGGEYRVGKTQGKLLVSAVSAIPVLNVHIRSSNATKIALKSIHPRLPLLMEGANAD